MDTIIVSKSGRRGCSGSFPLPKELVCVEVSKVYDQVAVRNCVSRSITLLPGSGAVNPFFSFEGAADFNIVEVKITSKIDSFSKTGCKRINLLVKLSYNIYYSDGVRQLTQRDEASYQLVIREIFWPNAYTQEGIIRSSETKDHTTGLNEAMLEVDALAQAFNDAINPSTGFLRLEIGAFFLVKCKCAVQLLMPSYGYCPVPPEQDTPSNLTCSLFNDQRKTPFPAVFNPLHKRKPHE